MNKRVLIVDFEPRRATASARWLEAEGYTVTLAVDAPGLDDVLLTTPPPVALIEPMLPGRDGFELCRLLKKGLYGSKPRVVLASRLLRGPRYKSLAQSAGADLFLERPGQDSVLLAALEKLCELGPESAAPSAAPSPVGNKTGANRISRAFPRTSTSGTGTGGSAVRHGEGHGSSGHPSSGAQTPAAEGEPAMPAAALTGAGPGSENSELDRMLDDVFNEIVGEEPEAPTGAQAPEASGSKQKASALALEEPAAARGWEEDLVEDLSATQSGALSLGDTLHDDVSSTSVELERELSGAFAGEKSEGRGAIPLSSPATPAVEEPAPEAPRPATAPKAVRAPVELSEPVPGVEPASTVAGPATGPPSGAASGPVASAPPATPEAPPEAETPTAAPAAAARSAERPPAQADVAPGTIAGGGKGKLIAAVVAVAALAAIAAGVYFVFFADSWGSEPAAESAALQAPATPAPATPAPASESTEIASDAPAAAGGEDASQPPKADEAAGGPTQEALAKQSPPAEAKPKPKAPERTVAAASERSSTPTRAPAASPTVPASKPEAVVEEPQESAAAPAEIAVEEPVAPVEESLIEPAVTPAETPEESPIETPIESPLDSLTEDIADAQSAVEPLADASEEQAPEAAPDDLGPLMAGVNGVSDPELIADSRVEPRYPDRAKQLGHRGKCRVILSVMIGTDGRVKAMEVLQEQVPHMGFAEEARSAVALWRFIPARLNGKPVEVKKTIVVNFAR